MTHGSPQKLGYLVGMLQIWKRRRQFSVEFYRCKRQFECENWRIARYKEAKRQITKMRWRGNNSMCYSQIRSNCRILPLASLFIVHTLLIPDDRAHSFHLRIPHLFIGDSPKRNVLYNFSTICIRCTPCFVFCRQWHLCYVMIATTHSIRLVPGLPVMRTLILL